MPAEVAASLNQPKISPRFLPVIDRVLITGIRLGPAGKQQVINKVLQLVPEWRRGDCWQRVRRLQKTLAITEPNKHQPTAPRSDKKCSSLPRQPHPRWTKEEDDELLAWAGYEPVDKIAERLSRSVRAVRFRLCALGMSGRVTDGWSLRGLMKLLRVSPDRLRHLIGEGILRVRDPRLTATSLVKFCGENPASFTPGTLERVPATARKREAYSWERAAELLGVDLPTLQSWISTGQLKVMDTFVTDRSFEEFCRKHGREIDMSLIDPATSKWLADEYGVPALGPREQLVPRAKKHALKVRTCRCGRKIAGNVFFRHLKACKVAANSAGYLVGRRLE